MKKISRAQMNALVALILYAYHDSPFEDMTDSIYNRLGHYWKNLPPEVFIRRGKLKMGRLTHLKPNNSGRDMTRFTHSGIVSCAPDNAEGFGSGFDEDANTLFHLRLKSSAMLVDMQRLYTLCSELTGKDRDRISNHRWMWEAAYGGDEDFDGVLSTISSRITSEKEYIALYSPDIVPDRAKRIIMKNRAKERSAKAKEKREAVARLNSLAGYTCLVTKSRVEISDDVKKAFSISPADEEFFCEDATVYSYNDWWGND